MTIQRAILCVDLSFGDTGKGTMIDALARTHSARLVVRFNGGAQAAHNVVTRDRRHHTFSQFGAATFVPGVETFLSRFVVTHPLAMLAEEEHLHAQGVPDAVARLSVDARALVITPFHQAANRLRELARGANRHGSCGVGVGETVSDALTAPARALSFGELRDPVQTRRKLRQAQHQKRDELRALCTLLRHEPAAQREIALLEDDDFVEDCEAAFTSLVERVRVLDEAGAAALLGREGVLLFEGAQGVLLDEWRGFHPYTTWSTTTFDNAEAVLREAHYPGEVTRLGILRAYATRHGAGPFVTEDAALAPLLPEPHNITTPWQQGFRRGHFDLVASRYALAACRGVDGLAITHLDAIRELPRWQVCDAYQLAPTEHAPALFSRDGEAIRAISLGPWQDLTHQEALAQALFRCAPRYQDWTEARDPHAYAERLAAALGAPLLATSSGPTAEDKALFGALHA